jgi:hypothetical protein
MCLQGDPSLQKLASAALQTLLAVHQGQAGSASAGTAAAAGAPRVAKQVSAGAFTQTLGSEAG